MSHNKENLVLIRSAQDGLILQVMFYKNEIRDFAAVPKEHSERPTRAEVDLAAKPASEAFLFPSFTRKTTAICTEHGCCPCLRKA